MSESTENGRDRALEHIETLLVAISVRSLPHRVGSLLDARLTLKQLKALTSLTGAESRTLTSLAAEFEVALPTMSGILDKLVQRGLVERVENLEDQRSKRLRLTPLGHAVIGEVVAPEPHLGHEIVEGMDLRELEALEVALTAVNRELRRVTEEGRGGSSVACEPRCSIAGRPGSWVERLRRGRAFPRERVGIAPSGRAAGVSGLLCRLVRRPSAFAEHKWTRYCRDICAASPESRAWTPTPARAPTSRCSSSARRCSARAWPPPSACPTLRPRSAERSARE